MRRDGVRIGWYGSRQEAPRPSYRFSRPVPVSPER